MINSIYILGNHIQALGIVRLSKNLNLKITIYNNHSVSIARYSKYCHHFIKYNNENDLLYKLLNIKSIDKILLIPTNDRMVKFLLDNHLALKGKYTMPFDNIETIKICYDKKSTYQKALNLGIPIPATDFPGSKEDLKKLVGKLKFPVVLKPSVMHTFFKATGKKLILCKNKEDLYSAYEEMSKVIPNSEIMIQQFLSGGPDNLYSFGSFSVNGKIFGGFTVNRIRQKPMDFGASTTYAVTKTIPEIIDISKKLLKGINYTGISEIEFMFDPESKEYKLLEINPRFWKWHYIANTLGINLLEIMIRYNNKDNITNNINKIENIAWEERITDYYIIIKEIFKRNFSFKDIINTIKSDKQYAVWDKKDPLPAMMYIILLPLLYYKRT